MFRRSKNLNIMNKLFRELSYFAFQRIYFRLQIRNFALRFSLLRVQFRRHVTQLAFKFNILSLQPRNAIIFNIHDNYPFLFWILYGFHDS